MQDRTKNVLQNTGAGVAAGVAIRASADYIFRDTNLCEMIVPPLFAKPVSYTPAIIDAISTQVNQEFNLIRDTIWPWIRPYPHIAFYELWAGNGIGTNVTKTALANMTHYALDIAPQILQESAMQICGDFMRAGGIIIPKILWWSAAAGAAGGLYYTYANWNKKPEEEQQAVSEGETEAKYNPKWYAAEIAYNTIQPVIEDAVKPAELNQKNSTPQLIAEVHIDAKSTTSPVATASPEPVSAPEIKKRLSDAEASSAARKAKLLSFHHEFGQTQKSLSPKRKEDDMQIERLNPGFAL